jgi:transaldolase
VLWASTSTKNPAYPDTLYVDELIGPDTVNTLPPETLKAFVDHGRPSETLTRDLADAQAQVRQLAELGIDLEVVTRRLQEEGVEAFAKPFQALLDSIDAKRKRLS